jgi:hypothetical protein
MPCSTLLAGFAGPRGPRETFLEHALHQPGDYGSPQELSTVNRTEAPQLSFLRIWLVWRTGFLAFALATYRHG